MTDIILMALLCGGLFFNKKMLPAVVAYGLCVVYQYTLFEYDSAVMNHVMYGVIFIPFVYFATMRLAVGMLTYSAFHLIVAVDYFAYPDINTFVSNNYHFMQILLALSLIYIGARSIDNGASSISKLVRDRVFGLASLFNSSIFTNKSTRG